MDPRLWELYRQGESTDQIMALVRLREGVAPPAQLQIVTRFGEIATCRLSREDIVGVRAHPAVASLKAPSTLVPDLFESSEEETTERRPGDERRPAGLVETGRGVVIGIVDWGCDFTHPSLRRRDGGTRLLALWDQQAPYEPARANRFGYGRVYRTAEIDRALATADPFSSLGYGDFLREEVAQGGSHGTHVTAIAAGNGADGGPVGIAPEAACVFVELASRKGGFRNLGDSVALLEALSFIEEMAGGQPFVVNLSMGNICGPHDASTLVEQAIDQFLLAAPGRMVCQSCGNYFQHRTHATRWIRPGETTALSWRTAVEDRTPNQVEVWYSRRDRLRVRLLGPRGEASAWCELGDQAELGPPDAPSARLYHRAEDPNNLDHLIAVFQYPDEAAGTWTLEIFGDDVTDGRLHAWIERDEACIGCQSRFEEADAVSAGSLNSICNGFRTITVGAYNAHTDAPEVASFSSVGPTRDGRRKPDLVAPGVAVLSARSGGTSAGLVRKSGTSMAAPHVTGTVALMMEAARHPLTNGDLRRLLLAAVKRPSEQVLEHGERARVGHGVLDVARAVELARSWAPPGRDLPPSSDVTDTHGEETQAQPTETDTMTVQMGCAACGSEARESEAPEEHVDGRLDAIIDMLVETIQPASTRTTKLTSAAIFEAFLARPGHVTAASEARARCEDTFELIGSPGRTPVKSLAPGDLIFETILGGEPILAGVVKRVRRGDLEVVTVDLEGRERSLRVMRKDGRLPPELLVLRLRGRPPLEAPPLWGPESLDARYLSTREMIGGHEVPEAASDDRTAAVNRHPRWRRALGTTESWERDQEPSQPLSQADARARVATAREREPILKAILGYVKARGADKEQHRARLQQLFTDFPEPLKSAFYEHLTTSNNDLAKYFRDNLDDATKKELLAILQGKSAPAPAARSPATAGAKPPPDRSGQANARARVATMREREPLLQAMRDYVKARGADKEQHRARLRQLFTGLPEHLKSAFGEHLTTSDDDLAKYFRDNLDGATKKELLAVLRGKSAPAPAPQGPATAAAAPPPDRAAQQRARLALLRALQAEMQASFASLDAALTSTKAYSAYVQVRNNVMQDITTSLNVADKALANSTAGHLASAIQTDLEKAQLWLSYLPHYAHLAALIRSAEHDRLISAVTVELAREADIYAQAFSVIAKGTASMLGVARSNALPCAVHTKKLLATLQEAIKSGQKAVEVAHKVEAVLDIPLEFGAGRMLPPIALVAILASDRAGFYKSHQAQFGVIQQNAWPLISELGWIEVHAPLTRKHVLHPIFKGMLLEAYHGATAADAAFIIGRVLMALAKKQSPVDWKTISLITVKVIAIVTLLHSPKLAVAGLAQLTTKTRESVMKAIGGDKDPKGIIADLNRDLGVKLTPEEAVDLLIELSTPPVEDHLRNLSAAVSAISPHILAIIADVQGTGIATQAMIDAKQTVSYPLLPPAP